MNMFHFISRFLIAFVLATAVGVPASAQTASTYYTAPSIAALKALTARPAVVEVVDANPGIFNWSTSSCSAADDIFQVTPTSGPTGCYTRMATPYATGKIALLPTQVALKAYPITGLAAGTTAYRGGFYALNDKGQATYTLSTSACTLNGGDGDEGSQVKPNSGTGCWLLSAPSYEAVVTVWGAKRDGSADALAAINAAKSWVNANGGGVVFFPAGLYTLSDTLALGNGSDSSASTIDNRIVLKGEGIGTGPEVTNVQASGVTRLLYDGATDAGAAVVSFEGPIHSAGIQDMLLDANGKAGMGFQFIHSMQGRVSRVVSVGYTAACHIGTTRDGLPSGVAYGNAENLFEQMFCYNPANFTADGIVLTSGVTGTLVGQPDSARNTFIGGTIFYGGSTGSAGIRLHGADNNVFIATLPLPKGGNDGGGHSYYFEQWAAFPYFPHENTFYNTAGTTQGIGGTSGTGGNTFWPLPVSDGLPPPTDPNLRYFTPTGVLGNLSKIVNGGSEKVNITADQFQFDVSGDDKGFAGLATGTPIFGLTRRSNNAQLSGFDAVVLEAGATGGPGTGTSAVTATTLQTSLSGRLVAPATPTSCSGQPTGTFWNDSGTVKVCP